jgi:hypothetical protein
MNSIEQKNLKLAFGAALASLSLKLGFFAGAEAPKPKINKGEATLLLRLLWPSL